MHIDHLCLEGVCQIVKDYGRQRDIVSETTNDKFICVDCALHNLGLSAAHEEEDTHTAKTNAALLQV